MTASKKSLYQFHNANKMVNERISWGSVDLQPQTHGNEEKPLSKTFRKPVRLLKLNRF